MPEEIIGEVIVGALEVVASSDIEDSNKKGCGCLIIILLFVLIAFGVYYLFNY
jgi:hypothetical protein